LGAFGCNILHTPKILEINELDTVVKLLFPYQYNILMKLFSTFLFLFVCRVVEIFQKQKKL